MQEFFTKVSAAHKRTLHGCRLRALGCLLLIILLITALFVLLFGTIRHLLADSPSIEEPLSVYLLIDNSRSMYEMNGSGSDPDMLRIDAARLFISYLGADNSQLAHECGVIFFGGQADVVVPLTRLSDDGRRTEIVQLIQNPPHLKWTDHVEALELALANLPTKPTVNRPALILLTDGKPELENGSEIADENYAAKLRYLSKQLASENIPLFIILLANDSTDSDADIAGLWKPIWLEMAEATTPGRFYEARQAADLLAIYHDIVVALTGSRTAGPIIQGEVGAAGLRQTVPVEPELQRLTLVVSKSKPELNVHIILPDGTPLSTEMPGVRHAGQIGLTSEEVWVIDQPVEGDWTILVSGKGQVIIWKDYLPKTVEPSAPPPMPTSTPEPEPIVIMPPNPSPSSSPRPVVALIDLPQAVLVNQPVAIEARITNPPDELHTLWLQLYPPSGFTMEKQLLDDGRMGDAIQDDGRFGGALQLLEPGEHLLNLQLRQGSTLLTQSEARLIAEEEPTLIISDMIEHYRVGENLPISAEWRIGEERLIPNTDLQLAPASAHMTSNAGSMTAVRLVPDEEGLLHGVFNLTQSGPLTMTVSAVVNTAQGQLVSQIVTTELEVKPPYPYWIWFLILALLGTTAAVYGYRRWDKRRPVIGGTLRHLFGPGFSDGSLIKELEPLHQTEVTVGVSPADIPLTGATTQFTIHLGQALGSDHEMLISGANVAVGDHSVEGKQKLNDASIISIGATKLKYENLRLRQARRHQEESLNLTSGWSTSPQSN